MAETPAQQFAKMPSSSKILLLALMLVLIGGAYYALFHSTLTSEIEAAQAAQVALRAELQESTNLQTKFLALREELEQRKGSEQQLVRILPPKAEIASMLADLNRLAELSGLSIETVEPRPEVAETYFFKIPVNLKLSGRYHQLAKFFYNVSRLQRAINMESISIGNPTLRGEDLILNVGVRATAFRRKDV
jgi:type IV pilus assembly protein PilO